MYIPEDFKETNRRKIFEFISNNDFGIMVATINGEMQAVHIPFLVLENENGILLKGHFAAGNKLSEAVKNKNEVLVIFHGPHAYISSSWYHHVNVPTWNYIAVHCYGKLNPVSDEKTQSILKETMLRYETSREGGMKWEQYSEKLISGLTKELIAFEIETGRVEAKYKLSQNRSSKDFQSVIEYLDNETDDYSKAIADEMKKRKQ